jgi:hypothetical protein
MAGADDVLAQKLELTLGTAARCAAEGKSDLYNGLEQYVRELEEMAAKAFELGEDWKPLVKKLRDGKALTAGELATLRALIVGDAEGFLKYDLEYDRSKADLDTIFGKMRAIGAAGFAPEGLMQLRILCQESYSLLAAASHYLERKERLARFEAATSSAIDRDAGKLLADIIEDMVH